MTERETEIETSFKSKKSNTEFIARGTTRRAFLVVTGEAATNPKVIKQIESIRKQGGDMRTVEWVAKQLSNTY